MRSDQFVYWLQGYFELSEPNTALTPKQVDTIKNHLKLVFLHEIDPSYSDNKVVQQIFQNIHDGKAPLYGMQGYSVTDTVTDSKQILKC
jgi:hypothetical protein